ncbi:MAG: EAL domain-containing protein [Proteobacteria bacterium]|nr:EAL domain-containing protein [Pseudomonadota bacterium]
MKFLSDAGGWNWSSVHKEQLASIARATPAAMAGYAVNVLLAAIAFRGLIALPKLVLWTIVAITICAYVGIRSVRGRSNRRRSANSGQSRRRPVRNALLFSIALALPWTALGTIWVGTVGGSEVILVALVVGMAASGSVLLSPIPAAAILYAATILIPLAVKCVFIPLENHLILSALALSFFMFLVGLIASNARVFAERLEAVEKLKDSVAALVSARQETERAAMTDGLTGVANRRAFMARLNMLASDRDQSPEYGVFYIDLDRFKGVNDAFGHAAGDAVLRMAASRIAKVVRDGDLVARLGGDEFAVVAQEICGRATAHVLAGRLVSALCEPIYLEGQRVQIGASIGVSIAFESDAAGDQLLTQADLAMYASKSAGRNSHCIFEADMLSSAEERRAVEQGLRTALAKNELELFFQPIHRLRNESIAGFECLIRWRHPHRGLLPPAQFLSIADEIGLANDIGAWVIEAACAQAAKWPSDIVVGINLSPLQIASDNVALRVERALKSSGLPASRLEIEITETSLLQNDPVTLDQLKRLKEMGVSIALDDFGTGYSSLSYLVSFPLDRIKIDRLFVSQLGLSRESDLIVRSITQLARNINCTVVAEGIETDEQLRKLRALHVGFGQGYLLGRPMPAVEATEFLASGKSKALAQSDY